MPQRVSDERLARLIASGFEGQSFTVDHLALDLRDARAEAAKWRECAEALASRVRVLRALASADGPVAPSTQRDTDAALARFDALKKEADQC